MTNQPSIKYTVDLFEINKSFNRQVAKRSGYSTLKSLLLNFWQKKPANVKNFQAIKDLTLRVPAGASVGVIGRNGSGKSTLLKLITGIYRPDSGHVKVTGRIAALIELGAGFHPDFSGRENLYLGGVLHGMTKAEIAEKFDEIVKFAELEDFIDDPVRTYSSGMFMRLGFSLAIHTNPDVLLIDEVLAVGDAKFTDKCKEKVAEMRRLKKTLFLVSHDLAAIERWCDEVVWLERGVVRDRGEPRRVIDHYREFIEKGEEADLVEAQAEEKTNTKTDVTVPTENTFQPERWGSREAEITSLKLLANNQDHLLVHTGDPCQLQIDYKVNAPCQDLVFGFAINRADGLSVVGTNTDIDRAPIKNSTAGTVKVKIPHLDLQDGVYYIDVAVHRQDGYAYDYHKNALKFIVRNSRAMIGIYHPQHTWEFQ